MKEKLNKIRNSPAFLRVYGILCLLALLYYPLASMIPEESRSGSLIVLQVIAAVLLAMYAAAPGKKRSPEEILLGIFFLWVLFTRILLRDFTAGLGRSILFSALACGIHGAGRILSGEGREKLLRRATALICGLLFLWGAIGILIVLTGTGYLPLIHKNITLTVEAKSTHYMRYLTFFSLHRNDTSAWFMIGLWLLISQWFRCQKKLWKVCIVLAALLFYGIIALQHCRSVYVATAGGFAMLALLVLMPRKDEKKPLRRWILAAAAAAVCLGVAYGGYSVFNSGISRAADTTNRVYAQLRGYESELSENVDFGTSDNRNLLDDAKSMTGRTTVWKAVWKTRTHDPRLGLLGHAERSVTTDLMDSGVIRHYHAHTHNLFVEALGVYGFPGMLLYAAFVLITLLRMLRSFFRREVPVSHRFLTVPLTTLLVYGTVEALLSPNTAFASLCFLLIGGIFAAGEEKIPSKQKKSVAKAAVFR